MSADQPGGRMIHECGSEMYWTDCEECGGGGYFELYEQDPLWYDQDDVEECQVCEGVGGWYYCPACNSPAAVSSTSERRALAEDGGEGE